MFGDTGSLTAEVLEVSIPTDGSGDGAVTVALTEPFGATPTVVLGERSDDAVSVTDVTAESFDAVARGAATENGAVTASMFVAGPRGGA